MSKKTLTGFPLLPALPELSVDVVYTDNGTSVSPAKLVYKGVVVAIAEVRKVEGKAKLEIRA